MAQFVGTGDLVRRWKYSRQGINQWLKKPGFPPPAFTVNGGRTRVWDLSAIEAFEVGRPELGDPEEKRRKVIGYARAVAKGPEGRKKRQGLPDGNTPQK